MSLKKLQCIVLLIATSSDLVAATPAFATGLGGYLSYGNVDGSVDFNFNGDYKTDRFGIGFVMDTNVATDRLFNYRLELGYQKSWREFDVLSRDIEFSGFTWNNYFGFAPYRSQNIRLWMGPTLRFSVDAPDEDNIDLGDWVALGAGIGILNSIYLVLDLIQEPTLCGQEKQAPDSLGARVSDLSAWLAAAREARGIATVRGALKAAETYRRNSCLAT
jgi:hypothetical protein